MSWKPKEGLYFKKREWFTVTNTDLNLKIWQLNNRFSKSKLFGDFGKIDFNEVVEAKKKKKKVWLSVRKNEMRKSGDCPIALSRILAVNGRIEGVLFMKSDLGPSERLT